MRYPRAHDTYESLIGERTREEALRLSASSLTEEHALVETTIDELVRAGFYPEAGELEQTYRIPAFSSPHTDSVNVTRIADLVHGITRTRFIPNESGYVFEAQSGRSRAGPVVIYHASPRPLSRSQYDPDRVGVEWIDKDPSKDHSIERMRDREFKKQFKSIDTAVRITLDQL